MNLERLTQQELATLLCVEARTLRNAAKEGIPSHGAGKGLFYVWTEVFPWWLERSLKVAVSGRAAAPATRNDLRSLTESDRIKAAAEADIAEMKAAKMRGELMDTQETKQVWNDFLSRLRSNLAGYPDRVGPQIVAGMNLAEIIEIMRDAMNEALAELAKPRGNDHAAA